MNQTFEKRKYALGMVFGVVVTLLSLGLGGCGSGNSAPAPVTPAAVPAVAGIFPTQYGCLAQGTCPAGQAWYQALNNNAGGCVPVTSTVANTCSTTGSCSATCGAGQYATQYGCLPQSSCTYGQAWYQALNNNAGGCVPITTPTGCANNGSTCTIPGQYPTQYGCLAQGSCIYGQAWYPTANLCVPITSNGAYGGTGYPGGYGYPGYPYQGYPSYPYYGYPTYGYGYGTPYYYFHF